MEGKADTGLVREASELASRARSEMAKRIVGKESLVRGILMGVIGGGHVLLEGVPGLAKTLAVKTLAEIAGLAFNRVQFTPDLLPADITGSLVYEQGSGRFVPRRGPVFCNLLLADEVNRAPAKVQSALLEAMEERQVTIGEQTMALPEPFFVLATQNPIEHEGTYPLPEAQLDRFLIKVLATYPSLEEEADIVRRVAGSPPQKVNRVLSPEQIALMRAAADSVQVDEGLAAYAVRLVRATRPESGERREGTVAGWGPSRDLSRDIARWVEYGASPRASIHLYRCARISALLDGRAYVMPDDVKVSAPDVLRHRLVLSYEAEAEGLAADDVIARVLSSLALP
ncbi:MAG TPA: MoxR family ATPase [Rectinemataceae bacterium]|nr:MoxR family ATPase [Rectinemataceae bacterium]